MTPRHLIITVCAGITWCLITALLVRGLWLYDTPLWATIDIFGAFIAFYCHLWLEPFERFADQY